MKVTAIFMTPESGMVVHHTMPTTPHEVGPLLGVQVPWLFFALRGKTDDGHTIKSVPMRDFIGLENADQGLRVYSFVFV